MGRKARVREEALKDLIVGLSAEIAAMRRGHYELRKEFEEFRRDAISRRDQNIASAENPEPLSPYVRGNFKPTETSMRYLSNHAGETFDRLADTQRTDATGDEHRSSTLEEGVKFWRQRVIDQRALLADHLDKHMWAPQLSSKTIPK